MSKHHLEASTMIFCLTKKETSQQWIANNSHFFLGILHRFFSPPFFFCSGGEPLGCHPRVFCFCFHPEKLGLFQATAVNRIVLNSVPWGVKIGLPVHGERSRLQNGKGWFKHQLATFQDSCEKESPESLRSCCPRLSMRK